ncbi:MAG: T9SS type A sorting domain-containing protein [Candidatus Coatesbacteria bacterium]|nr:T9SS type A sorting domain-containing protein [Candidatus Coatesbacteria bacterium]
MKSFYLLLVFFALLSLPDLLLSKVVLFDLTKDELAGNADWTIGESPDYRGAYSDFGEALRNIGYETRTLKGTTITESSLNGISVFVIPEPQIRFTENEISAVTKFVNKGGGVFLIGNHKGSDRNNDGYDSPEIFNYWTPEYFNIEFDNGSNSSSKSTNFTMEPISYIIDPRTPITEGVNSIGEWSACTLTPYSSAKAHIWIDSSHNKEAVLTSTYGSGRIAAIGDSSPFDDGTGNSGNELYDGWSKYDDARLAVNIVRWLAGDSGNGFNESINGVIEKEDVIKINPNPSFGKIIIENEKLKGKKAEICIYDINGNLVLKMNGRIPVLLNLRAENRKIQNGIYFVKINIDKIKKLSKLLLLSN